MHKFLCCLLSGLLAADRKVGGRRAADIENRHYYSRGYRAAVRADEFSGK